MILVRVTVKISGGKSEVEREQSQGALYQTISIKLGLIFSAITNRRMVVQEGMAKVVSG